MERPRIVFKLKEDGSKDPVEISEESIEKEHILSQEVGVGFEGESTSFLTLFDLSKPQFGKRNSFKMIKELYPSKYRFIHSVGPSSRRILNEKGFSIYKEYHGEVTGESVVNHIKQVNKILYKKFGSVKILKNICCSMLYRVYIDPIKHHFKKHHPFMGLNRREITRIWLAKDILDQCLEDDIYNISPFIKFSNKSPRELKRMFGKGMWKSFCKNSFYRNSLLAKIYYEDGIFKTKFLTRCAEYPSSFLKIFIMGSSCVFSVAPEILEYLCDYYKKERILSKISAKEFMGDVTVFSDTRRMHRQLFQEDFKEKNFEKILELHEEYTREINNRKKIVSKEPFPNEFGFSDIDFLKEGNIFTCKRLTNAVELANEGRLMGHCVASYSDKCMESRSVIYSIIQKKMGKNKKISTVEFDLSHRKIIQHSGKKNSEPKEEIKKIVNRLEMKLKEQMFEYSTTPKARVELENNEARYIHI